MSNQPTAEFLADGASGASWVVEGATVRQVLNSPYRAEIDIHAGSPEADPLQLLGKSCVLRIHRGTLTHNVCGIVTTATAGPPRTEGVWGQVVVEPALAALRARRDTRIFQEMTVPQILEQVLGAGLGAYGRGVVNETQRSYPPREYTVQYKETDFAFAHRLMEEEGILYYFDHEGGSESLIFIDDTSAHPPFEGLRGSMLEYSDVATEEVEVSYEYATAFVPRVRLRSTEVVTRHFDWTHPSMPVEGAAATPGVGDFADGSALGPARESYEHDEQLTLYAYGGSYQAHDATDQARVRRDAQKANALKFQGRSVAVGIRPGRRVSINAHPRPELNRDYLITEAMHRFGMSLEGDAEGGGFRYDNTFVCAPAELPFRPQKWQPRPRIAGVQTATVVGPAGEEIYTDEHGRIKVQFHWDRLGARNESSSCWIRVMQTMAGPGWGGHWLPRIGMEVVVTFIDGDPDRPLVTGCVYNGDNPPPLNLPAEKTRNTIKSNSSLGGGGFNEFRFEDLKGEEQIWMHGEKDWDTVIKHDLTRQVGHDETQSVGHDRARQVGHDEALAVGNDRSRQVGRDEQVGIGRDRSEQVGQNETLAVGANRSRQVALNEVVMVGVNQSLTVGAVRNVNVGAEEIYAVGADRTMMIGSDSGLMVAANRSVTIGVNESVQVGGDSSHKTAGSESQQVGGSLSVGVGGSRSVSVGQSDSTSVGINQMINVGVSREVSVGAMQNISVGGVMHTEAGMKYSIKCGGTEVILEKSGKVIIKGSDMEITASGTIGFTAAEIEMN